MVWTDDRMDDLARRMDAGFAHTDHQIATLRTELKGDIDALRTELKGDIDGLRTGIEGLQSQMFRFSIAMMVGPLSLAGALIGVIVSGP